MSMRDVKVCLLGESGVGKSSIVMRFVTDKFKQALESTIGASFMTKTIVCRDNTYKFQIWDTAGQEKYRALAPMYYRGSAAAIIVYDVTRESSFLAVKSWVHELQRHGPHKIVLAIAGNKCDLEDLREVREKDAQDYAKEIGAIFCETSALKSQNIGELFNAIGESNENIGELFNAIALMLPSEDLISASNGSRANTVQLRASQGKEKKGCCGGSSSSSGSNNSSGNRQKPSSYNHSNNSSSSSDRYSLH